MIPEWLIITVGVAIVLALTWPLILAGMALAVAALCSVLVGLMDLIESVGRKTGFYRWRHQRRIKTGYYRKRMDRKRGRR